jgi:hypothetical protein
MVALFAVTVLEPDVLARLPSFARRLDWFSANKPEYSDHIAHTAVPGEGDRLLLSIVDPPRIKRILRYVLDPAELLSDHGVRSLSRVYRDQPYSMDVSGVSATIDYEPAESTNYLFGGNSNWRGPVWFPVNILLVEALRRFAQFFGDDLVIEHPTGSGIKQTLHQVADDLDGRLIRVFLNDADGRRPVFGGYELFQTDPAWHEQLWFHEYFHGDTGAGLGASHQTGWTGLVAECLLHRHDPKAVIPPR